MNFSFQARDCVSIREVLGTLISENNEKVEEKYNKV